MPKRSLKPGLRAAYQRAYSRDLTRRRKATGLCVKCGGARDRGSSAALCSKCLVLNRSNQSRIKAERRAAGVCINCGAEKEQPDRARCDACLKWAREYRKQWINGSPKRCKDCGVVHNSPRTVCDRCAEARRIYKAERRRRGVPKNSA